MDAPEIRVHESSRPASLLLDPDTPATTVESSSPIDDPKVETVGEVRADVLSESSDKDTVVDVTPSSHSVVLPESSDNDVAVGDSGGFST